MANVVYAIWDAVNDPVVGYLSDNTRTRWVRLRPWLAADLSVAVVAAVIAGMGLGGTKVCREMILAGLVVGTFGAFGLTRLLESILFGVTASDPISLVSAIGLLSIVGLAACVVPALRAMRIAPVRALTSE